MSKLRTLHIYGSTNIESEFCPVCQREAFVFDRRMSCCGLVLPQKRDWQKLKIEIDTSNKKRRKPDWFHRNLILSDQNNRCFYCGDEFGTWRKINGQVRMVNLNWDHVVPFSFNGNNHEFVAACRECNGIKRVRHFADANEAKRYVRQKLYERKTPITA